MSLDTRSKGIIYNTIEQESSTDYFKNVIRLGAFYGGADLYKATFHLMIKETSANVKTTMSIRVSNNNQIHEIYDIIKAGAFADKKMTLKRTLSTENSTRLYIYWLVIEDDEDLDSPVTAQLHTTVEYGEMDFDNSFTVAEDGLPSGLTYTNLVTIPKESGITRVIPADYIAQLAGLNVSLDGEGKTGGSYDLLIS